MKGHTKKTGLPIERRSHSLDRRAINSEWLNYAHYVWCLVEVFRPRDAVRLARDFWQVSHAERDALGARARSGQLFRKHKRL